MLAVLFASAAVSAQPAKDWRLVWFDEFDGKEIDQSKWDFDVDCWGGGNDERQCYTDRRSNAAVKNGMLVITARKERATGPAFPLSQHNDKKKANARATKNYSSARLVTRGKAAWRYGKIEVRAKLPQGQGTWPAIWMLPEGNAYGPWARSGEIDIMEAVNLGVKCKECLGGRENRILGTLHFGNIWPDNKLKSNETSLPGSLDDFHVFGVIWEEGRIVWTIDGQTVSEQKAGDWYSAVTTDPNAPFNRRFHIILNLAIGGKLAESRGIGGVDPRGFPKDFEIDWVRVWQCDHDPATGKGCA
ncbi:MAG: glycoside hydrolase family 16 protein [Sphingorhabdus sp.]